MLNGLKIFILLALVQACSSGQEWNTIKLGPNGNLHCIVIPDNPDPVIRFSASELETYLQKITGIRLPVLVQSEARGKKGYLQLMVQADTSLKQDGFSIMRSGKGLRIISRESRGVLYGVYSLLEQCGCSFFYPGSEEIVPRKEEIVFNGEAVTCNPALEHRGLAPYGFYSGSIDMGRKFIDWMAKNRLNYILVSEDRPSDSDGPAHGSVWKEVQHDLLPELRKRGFVIEMSEHCAPVFFPRSLFKDHPDWFALIQGVRRAGPPPYSGQICYSNKDAVEYYANAIAAYASKHPEFHVIGTWPLDGGEYCECENCKDPFTVLKAAIHVAEKVKKVRPDMIVEHLAYKTWQPPRGEIPENMSVLWCPDAGDKDSLAREWVKKTRNAGGFYQFEYYMGDNYRSRSNVWLRPGYAVIVAKHASEMGYKGVISLFLPIQSWWRSAFNTWFFAKACWDRDLDIRENLHNYCMLFYGKQGAEIEPILDQILQNIQFETSKDPRESAAERLDIINGSAGDILARLRILSNQASDADVSRRISHLITYVEYSQLYCQAQASQNSTDLKRLADYSRAHPEQQMVLMYPEYIAWRNLY